MYGQTCGRKSGIEDSPIYRTYELSDQENDSSMLDDENVGAQYSFKCKCKAHRNKTLPNICKQRGPPKTNQARLPRTMETNTRRDRPRNRHKYRKNQELLSELLDIGEIDSNNGSKCEPGPSRTPEIDVCEYDNSSSMNNNLAAQSNSNAMRSRARRPGPVYAADRGVFLRRARFGDIDDPTAPGVRFFSGYMGQGMKKADNSIRMEEYTWKPCTTMDKIYFDTLPNEEFERFLRHSKRIMKKNLKECQEIMRSVDNSYVIGLLSRYGPKAYPKVNCPGLMHRSCRH